jgi:hypothetical protein
VWLPARLLKIDYRHDLIKMEALLREAIRNNVDRATHRSYVDQELAAVDADPVWPPLVPALTDMGKRAASTISMRSLRTRSGGEPSDVLGRRRASGARERTRT